MIRINREDAQCIMSPFDLVESLAFIDAVMVVEKDDLFNLIISHEKPADGYSLAEIYSTFYVLHQYLTACEFKAVIVDEEERIYFNAYGLSEVDINELVGPLKHVETTDIGVILTAIDRGEEE